MSQTSSDQLAPGTVISGRYTIEEHLASGGMADVYVALQAPLERRVALKILKTEGNQDEATTRRFHQEAVALSRLTHPNTITIFDFGTTDEGQFYLVMELLDGEPLSARLQREGPIPVEDAVDIAVQVARSLSEAHELGIVHRDLKPENIFLGRVERNLVKVLDFGIATGLQERDRVTKLTQAGTVPGTPEYMSPEHAQGQDLDGRSDLYSLGVVFFEMLTGDVPFTGPTSVAVALKHVNEDVPRLPPSFEPPIAAFVRRVLAKAPAARPASAQAFVTELLEAADSDDSSSHARRVPPPTRAPERASQPQRAPERASHSQVDTSGSAASEQRSSESDVGTARESRGHRSRSESPRGDRTRRAPERYESSQHTGSSPGATQSGSPRSGDTRPARQSAASTPDDVFMAFAEPILQRLGDRPRAPALKRNLDFAINAWNAVVEGPDKLAESRQWIAANGTPEMRRVFETLVSRKERDFADHDWAIEDVAVETGSDGVARGKIEIKEGR